MKRNIFRAGSIVTLNDAGHQMYPEHAGKDGVLEGYNSPTEARVSFPDRTVEIGAVYLRALTDRNMMPPGERNRQIVERRKIVRAAFDVVRHDPTRASDKASFLEALAGRKPITDELIHEARTITGR